MYNTDMKTKLLQDIALKSFSPSSSSVSYTGKADGTTEMTRPLYFIGDKTNLRVKSHLSVLEAVHIRDKTPDLCKQKDFVRVLHLV